MVTTVEEDLEAVFPKFSEGLDHATDFFHHAWELVASIAFVSEVVVVAVIFFFSYLIQKKIKELYLVHLQEEEKISWGQRLFLKVISFTVPVIALALLSLAMSISARFVENLEVYKLSIKFTLIWFIWTLIVRTIPDLFVRWVVCCTLIPLLIFSTLGLSNPVFNYLDSLGFSLVGIHLSIFLILKALLVATCLFWIAGLICQGAISFIESQEKMNPDVRDLMGSIVKSVLYISVVLITLDLVGIDLKSLAIVGGAMGIGIGLGLQKIAANFISGIILLIEQNIKVGHYVEIPGGGGPGWIRHLGARAAVIDTGDGKGVLIPNEELLTKTVIDWTYSNRAIRSDLEIKVAYRSNLERAKEIMLEAAANHPTCSKIYRPTCFLEKFTDNGAQFLLLFWVDDLSVGKLDMQNDVLLTIWRRFGEENIEFSLPLHYPS